jgi:hypothetical protein
MMDLEDDDDEYRTPNPPIRKARTSDIGIQATNRDDKETEKPPPKKRDKFDDFKDKYQITEDGITMADRRGDIISILKSFGLLVFSTVVFVYFADIPIPEEKTETTVVNCHYLSLSNKNCLVSSD